MHTSTPLYPALSEMLVNHTDKCHTQVYDKSNLVMLSPDAPLYMEEYDPKKIYIIGGKLTHYMQQVEILYIDINSS